MVIKQLTPAKDTLAANAKLEKQMAGDWRQSFFELITNYPNDVKEVFVHQILDMNNNHKLKTAKRMGYKFPFETNND